MCWDCQGCVHLQLLGQSLDGHAQRELPRDVVTDVPCPYAHKLLLEDALKVRGSLVGESVVHERQHRRQLGDGHVDLCALPLDEGVSLLGDDQALLDLAQLVEPEEDRPVLFLPARDLAGGPAFYEPLATSCLHGDQSVMYLGNLALAYFTGSHFSSFLLLSVVPQRWPVLVL